MDFLINHVEALIFCNPGPIQTGEIKDCLSEMFDAEVPDTDIQKSIDLLMEKYQQEAFSFEILKTGGGYQFMTKPAYQSSIGILLKQKSKKRLSNSSLETLAIVAYKQPVTKTEVEQIRGVNCDYAIQKLLEKELIEIKGKSDAVGRPLIYGTSQKFMEYFGINHLHELPSPKDFGKEDNMIGQQHEG
ncbi:MAG: SMC-Scp complex subunit ScpB [Cyclobacteriaceae bacterium]|nr:SMC-Scp complex subunit ScpB [Cyclobacteriaceae bacterium]